MSNLAVVEVMTVLPAWFGTPVAAAAVITTKAATITAEAASTAAATILAWFGFVDFERTTTDFLAVKLLDRRSRFFLRRHFDEAKSSRASRIAVFHNIC